MMKAQTQQQQSSQRRRCKPNRFFMFLYNRKTLPSLRATRTNRGGTERVVRIIGFVIAMLLVGRILFVALAAKSIKRINHWIDNHSQCYSREAGVIWKESPIHAMHRPCPRNFGYKTLAFESSSSHNNNSSHKLCITTLTDKKSTSTWQRLLRCRDFDQVASLTWPNYAHYAQLHNYTIFDASDLIDTSRPPAWSKILAVLHLLNKKEETATGSSITNKAGNNEAAVGERANACDWVLWLDADVVIMNSSIALESILPAAATVGDSSLNSDTDIDLIVTMDRRFTANSGVWLIRNSKYSKHFLQTWWNMRTWVREPGLSLSGDNAAFGHLIQQELSKQQGQQQQHQQHVVMIPKCIMNSFGAFVTSTGPMEQPSQDKLYSQNYYHAGDFIAHASGIDQKAAVVQLLLNRAT